MHTERQFYSFLTKNVPLMLLVALKETLPLVSMYISLPGQITALRVLFYTAQQTRINNFLICCDSSHIHYLLKKNWTKAQL